MNYYQTYYSCMQLQGMQGNVFKCRVLNFHALAFLPLHIIIKHTVAKMKLV